MCCGFMQEKTGDGTSLVHGRSQSILLLDQFFQTHQLEWKSKPWTDSIVSETTDLVEPFEIQLCAPFPIPFEVLRTQSFG